ncbi:MAG: hypothetical protein J4N98_10005 [Chloroflexi bacterium]|nr:hypothetical protein [Chloroflexota bacterium]
MPKKPSRRKRGRQTVPGTRAPTTRTVAPTVAMAAPSTPAPAERSLSRAKQRDYSYVQREVRRIAILATGIFIVIIVLSFFVP